MKKILYVVPALLLLASCTREVGIGEDTPDTENIRFGVVVEDKLRTRAAITDESAFFGSKIKVWAGFENEEANPNIAGKEITVGASEVTSTLLWNEDNRKQYFYALHPAESAPALTVSSSGSNSATFSYTVSGDANGQTDLMVAGSGPYYKEPVVPLAFSHALTRITFEAKINGFPTESVVKLTKVQIKGARNAGNGKFTGTTFAWTGKETGTADFSMTVPVENPLTLNSIESQKINPTNISNSDGYDNMFLLPHSEEELAGVNLVIYFTVNSGSEENHQIALGGLTYETDGWVKGEWINYQITLSPEGIDVESTILNWEDEGWEEELEGAV